MKTYNTTYDMQQQIDMEFGSYHLSDNKDIYEPQRKNTFEFIVTGLKNMIYAGMNPDVGGTNEYTRANADDILRLCVKSSPVPHFTQKAIAIRRGNSVMKAAGLPDFDNGQITVRDFIGTDVKEILMAWQNKSYNVTTQRVGLMSEYKKDATLIEYSPNYVKVRSWQLKGCWVSSIKESGYDQESGDQNEITVTIEYDYAYPLAE